MNFHKAKILLEKINRLYAGMHEAQDHISPIEKELMMNYVREFYELFYWDSRPDKSQSRPAPAKTIAKDTPSKVVAPPQAPSPTPVAATPVKEESVPASAVETPPASAKKNIKKETPPKVVAPVPPRPKPEPPKPQPTKIKVSPPRPVKEEHTPEMEALFETKKATELSEKLGLSPIMDLNRAFGLNDKMLYTNELFGGNNNIYKETMGILNSFNSMEQAKVYLIKHVAEAYGWADKGKRNMAKTFIRTVRRKYV